MHEMCVTFMIYMREWIDKDKLIQQNESKCPTPCMRDKTIHMNESDSTYERENHLG